jgi:FAD/FMN-containing dehydrogenase/Fe-S oxidoreductase
MAVFYPNNEDEIIQMTHLANERGFYFIAHGGGTGLTGGCVPLRKRTMIMSLQEMCEIKDVEIDTRGFAKIWTQAGSNTKKVMDKASEAGFFHAVDPASNKGCTVGGNLANGAGGASAFEFGTAIDNVLEYRQVLPDGTQIHARRLEPSPEFRGQIQDDQELVFEISTLFQGETIIQETRHSGNHFRREGLAKDVMNKVLGGIPGIQKEGTDGVITDICWALHEKPEYSFTVFIETSSFAEGDSFVQAIIKERFKENHLDFRILKLEQWDKTYAEVIDQPCTPESTFVIDIGSNDPWVLDQVKMFLEGFTSNGNLKIQMETFEEKREHLWHYRHQLKKISAETNGFKLNEDIVINIKYYKEFAEQFTGLKKDYQDRWKDLQPGLQEKYGEHYENKDMIIAYHAHYGDGNVHVNIPVHSQFPEMMELAHDFLKDLFEVVDYRFQGSATGEHGVGLTKKDTILQAKPEYYDHLLEGVHNRQKVDRNRVCHPGALDPNHHPHIFTPSHQKIIDQLYLHVRLTEDYLREHPDAEALIKYSPDILHIMIETFESVRRCIRCGSCRPECSFYRPDLTPQESIMSPREKNLILRGWIMMFAEHLFYDDSNLLPAEQWMDLKDVLNACSGCGRCAPACPAGIDMKEVVENIKIIIAKISQKNGDIRIHPWISRLVEKIMYGLNGEDLVHYPARLEKFFNLAGMGEKGRRISGFPDQDSPLFSRGDSLLELSKKNGKGMLIQKENISHHGPAKMFFPGCAENFVEKETAKAVVYLLTEAGHQVLIPGEQLCCGHPAEFEGKDIRELTRFNANRINDLKHVIYAKGMPLELLVNCGSCRQTLEKYMQEHLYELGIKDVMLTVFDTLSLQQQHKIRNVLGSESIGYKIPCHAGDDSNVIEELRKLEAAVQTDEECCGMVGHRNISDQVPFHTRVLDRAKKYEDHKITTMVSSCSGCTRANAEVSTKCSHPFQTKTTPVFIADALSHDWRKRVAERIGNAKII